MKNVQIICNSLDSKGVRVTLPDGSPVVGISSIDLAIRKDELVTAKIDLWIGNVDLRAAAEYRMQHPTTGEVKQVARLVFADGEVVELADYAKHAVPAPTTATAPQGEAEIAEVVSATYYDSMVGQAPHTYGWAAKPEVFKVKVRDRILCALYAARLLPDGNVRDLRAAAVNVLAKCDNPDTLEASLVALERAVRGTVAPSAADNVRAQFKRLDDDSLDAIMEVVGEGADFALYNKGKSQMRNWFLGRLRTLWGIPKEEPVPPHSDHPIQFGSVDDDPSTKDWQQTGN